MSVNGHGGKRAGAGRPPNSEIFAAAIASFHERAAADLDTRYERLAYLADGGYAEVEEQFEPAGMIQISEEVITKTGTFSVKKLAFPDLPPKELVCVRQVRRTAAPDRLANQYLIDRVAGKPVAAVEISGAGGTAIAVHTVNYIAPGASGGDDA